MKILFIDYLSYEAHKNFNKIHVGALQKLGCQIDFVGNKNQFDNVNDNGNISITKIEGKFITKRHKSPLISRLANIMFLLKIKRLFKISEYNVIIFPTYDILSLFFFKFNVPVILINHNNVSQLWSRIKLWMTRNLPSNYIHIALSEDMKEELQRLNPTKKCFYIPHGIIEPSNILSQPSFLKSGVSFIFCPVNRNYDVTIIDKLLESDAIHNYLRNKKISIVIKKITEKVKDTDSVKVINAMFGKQEYYYLIKNAQAVLLPYDNSFQYRCSGIMFECIAYNTPILACDIPALRCFENDYKINFFMDDKSFIKALENVDKNNNELFDKDKFNPYKYWKEILAAYNA